MKEQYKGPWVEELRSGRRVQGKHKLCRTSQDIRVECCLGVLSDLFPALAGWKYCVKGFRGEWHKEGCMEEATMIPEEAREELGITENEMWQLVCFNDNRVNLAMKKELTVPNHQYSFEEIADWIEENL